MKNLFLSLSLIGAAALVGCSKTETPAPAAPAEPAAAAAPAAPASQWPELRVAIDPTYKPFTYKTEAGEPAGFDVDVAKALCDELKSKCVFVEQALDGMIPGLQAKKYDAIISSMSITDERRKKVDFTAKYAHIPNRFVAAKGTTLELTPAGMAGKRIGVQRATTHDKYLTDNFGSDVTIVRYGNADEAYLDLKAGRVLALLARVAARGFREGAEYLSVTLYDPELEARFSRLFFRHQPHPYETMAWSCPEGEFKEAVKARTAWSLMDIHTDRDQG